MKLCERAMNFSMHIDRIVDDYNVFHSLLVGLLLKSYGYVDEVVAAGYLHDIPQTTNYTVDDIAKLYGGKVASLVMTSLNVDKDLEWRDKKNQTLKAISNLPEANMAIVCADNIITLEELLIKFKKNGKPDFSEFDISKEELENYYKCIYQKISKNFDFPLSDRLHEAIYNVFDKDIYYEFNNLGYDAEIFNNKTTYQENLLKLKTVISQKNPYIIEFVGPHKTGKSSIKKMINDFFNNVDFRVKVCEDNHDKNKYKNTPITSKASISTIEKNLLITSAIEGNLLEQIIGEQDVIMVESGLYDCLVNIKLLLNKGQISKERFDDYLNHFLPDLEFLINHVMISYVDGKDLLNRDINVNLNINEIYERIQEADKYDELLTNIEKLISSTTVIDTTKIDPREAILRVADTLFPIMKSDYIFKLKKIVSEKV